MALYVRKKEPIPEAVIAVFIDAGRPNELNSKEPPVKRQKRQNSSRSRQSFCLAKETLEFVRPLDMASSSAFHDIHFSDISGRLDVKLVESAGSAGCGDDGGWALWLAPSSTRHSSARQKDQRTWYALQLDPDLGIEERVQSLLMIPRDMAAKREEAFLRMQTGLSMSAGVNHTIVLKFVFRLLWNESLEPHEWRRSHAEREPSSRALKLFSPHSHHSYDWSPKHFYDAVFVPPQDDPDSASIRIPGLTATLYPYQKRTLQWLLNREGLRWSKGKGIKATSIPSLYDSLFRPATDAEGKTFYLSNLLHAATSDQSIFAKSEKNVKGGILADEMGLGKTLTSISLIILNPRQSDREPATAPHVAQGLYTSGATLIVTPEQLREQWQDELAQHAPQLRIKVYAGCKKVKTETDERDMTKDLVGYDVVLTTYAVLSSELDFALEPPERSSRRQRVYHRTKSPLVQIHWWRVCLDEAQMVENKVSRTATLARIIPRVNSWGITGTPIKSSVDDLLGLLLFLGVEPYCSNSMVWKDLISNNKTLFKMLVSKLVVRHTKSIVRDELQLPSQRRYVISLPFTAVEQHHYQSLFKEMAQDCALSMNGRPLKDDWGLEDYEVKMGSWLDRLRQAALHPEVGVRNRRALGTSKSVRLRTLDEVLDAMVLQSESAIRSEQRAYLNARLSRGQVLENGLLVREALVIWEAVREEAKAIVDECRKPVSDVGSESRRAGLPDQPLSNGGLDDDESGGEGTESSGGHFSEYRRRLRNALEIQHKAVFFCANAYYQIRDNKDLTVPGSAEFDALKRLEDEGYECAKNIRREILQEPRRKALAIMEKIADRASRQSFVVIPELTALESAGIETRNVVDQAGDLFDILNTQANLLDDWREVTIKLALKPLVDEDDDPEVTGDEYTDSAKTQDELVVFVCMVRAMIGDRQDAISGLSNELVRHESDMMKRSAEAGDGPAPGLFLKLFEARCNVKPDSGRVGSLRGLVGEIRTLHTRLKASIKGDDAKNEREKRVAAEIALVSRLLQETQAQVAAQTKTMAALDSEIELVTSVMNTRVEYYRQLQEISDGVAPLNTVHDDQEMNECLKKEKEAGDKLNTSQSKHRYLMDLKNTGSKPDEACIICQSSFNFGVLTICGHSFCKGCILQWFKHHKSCPLCKRPLKASNLHDIILRPQQLRLHQVEGVNSSAALDSQRSPASETASIYSRFTDKKLAEIKDIDLDGPSFTTKVDMLVRHLLWLRETDPGAKSIVFSQYSEFLNILRNAFTRFRIGFSSIDQAGGIASFKEDAGVEVFLLHARAHSSGLNLTNASHVFLCEPLLNTALELQAIARVDRIGQQHDTTVWLYLVGGTVEESIHNLSVQRRVDHVQEHKHENDHVYSRGKSNGNVGAGHEGGQEQMLEEANTLELEQAKLDRLMNRDRSLGEAVDAKDLWECLFGAGFFSDDADGGNERTENRAIMRCLAEETAV